jgi:FKBP-type peptidyl-prolyl cis-trans isomerase FklB
MRHLLADAMNGASAARLPRAAACLLLGALAAAGAQANEATPAPADADASYRFGLSFGEQLRRLGVTNELAPQDIARGVADALAGKSTTPEDAARLSAFIGELRQRATARNRAAARAFLDGNARDRDVRTTESGLQYRVLSPGNARAPTAQADSEVTVHYRGRLLDGTEFDSSYARGQPATFAVGGVIRGWQEALVLMRPGARWELFVPPDLAYGDNSPPAIPPGSLLLFEVELLSVSSPAGTR